MNTVIKFGFAALAAVTLYTWPTEAETPDSFTRHGLPVPGAYFKESENRQPATVALSKSGKGVGQAENKFSKADRKHIKHVQPASIGS